MLTREKLWLAMSGCGLNIYIQIEFLVFVFTRYLNLPVYFLRGLSSFPSRFLQPLAAVFMRAGACLRESVVCLFAFIFFSLFLCFTINNTIDFFVYWLFLFHCISSALSTCRAGEGLHSSTILSFPLFLLIILTVQTIDKNHSRQKSKAKTEHAYAPLIRDNKLLLNWLNLTSPFPLFSKRIIRTL